MSKPEDIHDAYRQEAWNVWYNYLAQRDNPERDIHFVEDQVIWFADMMRRTGKERDAYRQDTEQKLGELMAILRLENAPADSWTTIAASLNALMGANEAARLRANEAEAERDALKERLDTIEQDYLAVAASLRSIAQVFQTLEEEDREKVGRDRRDFLNRMIEYFAEVGPEAWRRTKTIREERDALEERLHATQEALKPFAEAGRAIDENYISAKIGDGMTTQVRVGDLRRAAEVIKPTDEEIAAYKMPCRGEGLPGAPVMMCFRECDECMSAREARARLLAAEVMEEKP